MTKLTIFLLIFFIMIISLVSAEKVIIDQTFSGSNGLQVEFPNFNYGMVNTNFEFPFHVYSLQTGLAAFTNVNCTLHVYSGNGSHLLIDSVTVPKNIYDYEFDINSSIFSGVGVYRFLVYCVCDSCGTANESLGGFSTHAFELTVNGEEPDKFNGAWLPVILAFIISALAFLYISFNVSFKILGLKVLFFLLGIANIFITLFSVYALTLNPGRVDLFSPVGLGLFSAYGLLLLLVIYLYGVHLMKNTINFKGDKD